jgi:nucleoside 2-deoxyribosyltransferase
LTPQSPEVHDTAMPQVYCAGPLFNDAERGEMSDIARVLEAAGHRTFLPHRDGLEFARLLPELQRIVPAPAAADLILQRAIFSLDVFQLLTRSDAVVANLNGRVPDEGTVVEAALGWLAGKAVVLYKTDARTVLSGSDHPMLLALGDFRVVDALDDLPRAVDEQLRADRSGRVPGVLEAGRRIAEVRQPSRREVAAALLILAT